jgi:hypothetical protein
MKTCRAAALSLIAVGVAAGGWGELEGAESWREVPGQLGAWLGRQVAELEAASWWEGVDGENWGERRDAMRGELRYMLGLEPLPGRSDLKAEVVGELERDGVVVERLHFQSMPGLYVTANLYRPGGWKEGDERLPAILYVCGHSRQGKDGVSFGNKVGYHHHGMWFGRHGYVCLVIDTIQLGEIEGLHHGTYREGRWWWATRGYTPAGVETWNGIRALDYLEGRVEVDGSRMGMTGRSGGGATTWWVAALDERVAATVPVAGITHLRDHVVEGCIEGHCDCMYMVNSGRWDFDRVAALVAPRPLLISNTDKDSIFPLEGVLWVHERARKIYRKLGAEAALGLHLAEGGHSDVQPLNIGAFHWMERHLKGASAAGLLEEGAKKVFEGEELAVFGGELPGDEIVTVIDEQFVAAAELPGEVGGAVGWAELRGRWERELLLRSFGSWPMGDGALPPAVRWHGDAEEDGVRHQVWRVESEAEVEIELHLFRLDGADGADGAGVRRVEMEVVDEESWDGLVALVAGAYGAAWVAESVGGDRGEIEGDAGALRRLKGRLDEEGKVLVYVVPRGVGASSWAGWERQKRNHFQRRLLLVGASLETGQVWDIRQAGRMVAEGLVGDFGGAEIWWRARGVMAGNVLHAALWGEGVVGLELEEMPWGYREGPIYPQIERIVPLAGVVAMVAERARVIILGRGADGAGGEGGGEWLGWVKELGEELGWGEGRGVEWR